MNRSELGNIVRRHLNLVAPEIDLNQIDPDHDLGSELDIDSMDYYTVMVAISQDLDIDIPEEQYGDLRTLNNILDFLEAATD